MCHFDKYRTFINQTKSQLYDSFLGLQKEPDFLTAKKVIMVFRGHGEEMIVNRAPGMVALDGPTIFFHRIMEHFFKGVSKDVYMFVDMCRAPIEEDVRFVPNSLAMNNGYFVMIHGTARSTLGYGKFGKAFFSNIHVLCRLEITLMRILIFIQYVILMARYEDITFQPKLYVNQAVQDKYPDNVRQIQTLTSQDEGSVRATKVGLDVECSAIVESIRTHVHTPLTCATAVKKFTDKCRFQRVPPNLLEKCLASCQVGLEEYRKELAYTRSRPKMESLDYWEKLSVNVTYLLMIPSVLLRVQPLKPDVARLRDEMRAVKTQLDDKLIPSEKSIFRSYQSFDLDKMITSLREMRANHIVTRDEVSAIDKLIVSLERINQMRKSGDVFNFFKDFGYYSHLKKEFDAVGLPENETLTLLIQIEAIGKKDKDKYIKSERRDIEALKKVIKHLEYLGSDKWLTKNEKQTIDELLKEYRSRVK